MTDSDSQGGLWQRIASHFRRSDAGNDPYAGYRKRLVNSIGKERTEIVRELVKRTERYHDGVDGHAFRVTFKDRLDEIHSLVRFVEETRDAKRDYRPRVLALVVSGTAKANDQLARIDEIVRYLAADFDENGQRKITAAEMSSSTSFKLEDVYESLCHVREFGIGGGSTTGNPHRPDWYFITGDGLFELPTLFAVLERQVNWVEGDARAAKMGSVLYDGHPDWNSRWRDRLTGWIGRHKYASLIYVGGTLLLGVLAYAAGWLEFIARFFRSS